MFRGRPKRWVLPLNPDKDAKPGANLVTLPNTNCRGRWAKKNVVYITPELLSDIGCEVRRLRKGGFIKVAFIDTDCLLVLLSFLALFSKSYFILVSIESYLSKLKTLFSLKWVHMTARFLSKKNASISLNILYFNHTHFLSLSKGRSITCKNTCIVHKWLCLWGDLLFTSFKAPQL